MKAMILVCLFIGRELMEMMVDWEGGRGFKETNQKQKF